MNTIIKIDGIRRVEDVDFINEVKPDYAGVMLSKRFRRGVSIDEAKAIRERLNKNIPLVGVFVNDQFMDALVALRQGIIDVAQLEGTESEEYIHDLQVMSRKPVIKACQMDSAEVIPYMAQSCASHILLDSQPESPSTFDWSMANSIKRPFFLSGGLNPDNVAKAMSSIRPWGINLYWGSGNEDDRHAQNKIRRSVEIIRSF